MTVGLKMSTKKDNQDFEKLLEQYDYSFKKGDLVKGIVCGFEGQGVLVDIGAKTAALVPSYEAVEKYGAFKGSLLAIWRIIRCNPFSKGGYDPVP